MASSYHHALSSAKRFGGQPEDYQHIHDWFDATKATLGDFRHRALRHHTLGIFDAERLFGTTVANSDGRRIPTRLIGEQHVIEDCGYLPTPQDWLQHLAPQAWMNSPQKLSRTIAVGGENDSAIRQKDSREELAGHASIAMTQRYIVASEDVKKDLMKKV